MIILLFAGSVAIDSNREGKTARAGLVDTLQEVVKKQWEEKMITTHSILMGLAKEEEAAFWDLTKEIQVESKLPVTSFSTELLLEEDIWEKVREENNPLGEEEKQPEREIFYPEFIPAQKKEMEYLWEEYSTMDQLIQSFYTVDATTSVEKDFLNQEELRSIDCSIDQDRKGPHILLYHTHSQEAFADSVAGKQEDTIVGAGEQLAKMLEEYGYEVLHHKGEYDIEKRDYAYSNALPKLEEILKQNPQIQVVIDLHRDAVNEDVRLVTSLQGNDTAKVMFFNGLGRTKSQGEISYLKNPYLKENLAFSFQMKVACDEYYPGFARNIYLRAYRYNMHLCPKTLLVELGAQTNTKEEILQALYPLAHVLDIVLSSQ